MWILPDIGTRLTQQLQPLKNKNLMQVSEKLQELLTIRDNLTAIAETIVLENKDLLTGLVIDQQYNQSVDSTGEPLRKYQTSYAKHKELAGIYRGKTDLSDTGAFQGAFNVAVNDMTYYIASPVTDANGELLQDILEAWHGAPIMDLTPENIVKVRDELNPIFAETVGELI